MGDVEGFYSSMGLLLIASTAAFAVPIVLKGIGESVELGIKGRYSVKCLVAGERVEKHRWVYDDLRMDEWGIARRIVGREGMNMLERKTKEYEKSFVSD